MSSKHFTKLFIQNQTIPTSLDSKAFAGRHNKEVMLKTFKELTDSSIIITPLMKMMFKRILKRWDSPS